MIYPVNKIAIAQGYHTGKSLDFGWHKVSDKKQDIIACDKGIVYSVEKQPNGGNVVYIKHEDDIISAYAHLGSICVKKGQKVTMAEKIGTMGKSGKTTGEHLHFGLYSKGKNIYGNADLDPFTYCYVYPNQLVYDGTQKKYGKKIKYYEDKKVWDKGDYILLYDKCLRKSHKIGLNTYKVKECSKVTQQYLTSKKPNDIAKIKKGTGIRVTQIYDEAGRIWGKMGNAWLVLCNRDGEPQATKIS